MEIDKKELKKTSRKFRQMASRVLNAHYTEINSVIKMFIEYIEDTPIINEYIQSIFVEYPNLQEQIKQVSASYGDLVLPTGDTPEQEITYVYQILKYISENTSVQTSALGWGYTSSKKFQDMVKEFGIRVVLPFVNGIDDYLSDIATDMGFDEESKFMINISGGQAQVNISNDNSTLNATQNIQVNPSEIASLIAELKNNIENELSNSQNIKNILLSQAQLIANEAADEKPKKEVLKTAINTIQDLLKTVPFAVTALESSRKLYELIAPLFS
ncbi:hypothetical protein [Leuconostoc mesenteroides]|uniref:hypothetical protein n=2 Tax=Leuconostoc mesenteroides TaxID=1245 RepID=UPI001238F696|nr:hypothetical protein [Leuconostoc mesenteroides]KAA8346276.1 hypothetical protein FE418_10370 [Leuconostoc mesenteroides]